MHSTLHEVVSTSMANQDTSTADHDVSCDELVSGTGVSSFKSKRSKPITD
jgi:hypothetical protein